MSLWAYPEPLVEGVFLRRYKRFFADVRLPDGREVVAHCANTGAMTGVATPGSVCRVLPTSDPKRKLKWSLEQMRVGEHWVMVHTARPNRLVEAAVRAGRLPALAGYGLVQRERPYGQASRIDLLLSEHPEGIARAFVEVKNVTLVRGEVASFPDAVSTRGTKHLEELAVVAQAGERGVLVPLIAHPGARVFAPADDVDPAWGHALRHAASVGVEVLPLVVTCSSTGLDVQATLPWVPHLTDG